jgi:hypothetical protein
LKCPSRPFKFPRASCGGVIKMAIKFYKGTKEDFEKQFKNLKTEKVEEIRIDSKTGAIYFLLEKEKERSIIDIDIDFINKL